jgi:hypothetical protein
MAHRPTPTPEHPTGCSGSSSLAVDLTEGRETCRWIILGEAADVHRSGQRARVLDALRNGPVEGLSISEIMAEAEIRSREAAWQMLGRMATDGEKRLVRVTAWVGAS